MNWKNPSHGTVVAYVALFVALAGTAFAAQARLGASDIKHPVVRKEKFKPTAAGGAGAVVARCHNNERLIGGAGGWNRDAGDVDPAPTISQAAFITAGGRATGYVVRGRAPALGNTLVAQALCLPR